MSAEAAIRELDSYAKMCVRHSHVQYDKHGTLHEKAVTAFNADDVWRFKWVPDDFDIGEARNHPVFQDTFTEEQRLAFNHLQWGLEYSVVGQGERQIIVLNNWAVKTYERVIPSVVELERRESFEEVDHVAAFEVMLEGLRQRYFPHRQTALRAISPSGFVNPRVNKVARHVIGAAGHKLLGRSFPTLFFLIRGLKTHNFKPFENAITQMEDGHAGMKMISHLHRLDESRHMATAFYLAKLTGEVFDELPDESRLMIDLAVRAAFPPNRSADYRLWYWRQALDEAVIFKGVPKPELEALYAHMVERTHANLGHLHALQERLTRQANKRIIEEAGLSPAFKRAFLERMRQDPLYRPLVDAVELPEA
ncbi:MAG: hypothetical protein H6741_07150 [Alphaproteobacteria bacterium]|nr:hypothetical protein [Alphaproteobacteria bacterium]